MPIDVPLTLKHATDLIGDASRYFVAVYEEFKFKETDPLKDYLDFILHEPVEWIKGFPLKLRTRLSFAKPKAAVIRLLKVPAAIQTLGMEYCSKAHDVIWDTFKKHGDTILDARIKKGFVGAGETVTESVPGPGPKKTEENDVSDSGSEPVPQNTLILEEVADLPVEADDISEPPTMTVGVVGEGKQGWEGKYHILEKAFRALLEDRRDYGMMGNISSRNNGLVDATLILLNAFNAS